jgi:hypothetical protein
MAMQEQKARTIAWGINWFFIELAIYGAAISTGHICWFGFVAGLIVNAAFLALFCIQNVNGFVTSLGLIALVAMFTYPWSIGIPMQLNGVLILFLIVAAKMNKKWRFTNS